MTEAEDYLPLRSKRKAITALLPYAVWRERDGQHEMLNVISRSVRASRMLRFVWDRAHPSFRTLFSNASPHAIVLTSPYVPYIMFIKMVDLVRRWVAAVSTVSDTEGVAQSVVVTLLRFASYHGPLHIPADIWSWLTKQPSVPPVCRERDVGTYAHVVATVRALKDINIFKSYLLLVWSEWNGILSNCFDSIASCCLEPLPRASHYESCSFCLMRFSIWEDFSGVGMGHHRGDLVHRLDYVITRLDSGEHNPWFGADDLRKVKVQYRTLRETLLETNKQAINRTPHFAIMPLRMLTPTPDGHRIPHNIYVYAPSPMSIVP